MRVEQIMNVHTKVCHPYDVLNQAAQIMWDNRCGAVPVVDERGHPVGLLTDRDICMAAYTQGKTLNAVRVDQAMTRDVVCCNGDDELISAAELMRQHGKRRLPVVNPDGVLIGLLSLDDIAHEAARGLRGGVNLELRDLVLEVVLSINRGRVFVRPPT